MILDRIVAQKRRELGALHTAYAQWQHPLTPLARRDFRAALLRPGLSLIAEFKRRSPSRGEINAGADPGAVAEVYQVAGAAALSVLTDLPFFAGSLADLTAARERCCLPVLRKDFIIDPVQVAESAGPEGPDCLLLIAAILEVEELRALRELAAACGQAALVEVHGETDLEKALASGAEIVGINNRDLRTFALSLETTLRLRPRVPAGVPVVAESGIHTRDDVLRLEEAGVDAMLVGEALMQAADPGAKVKELLGIR